VYRCFKKINSGKNRTITFQQTLHNHKALTENTLQRQVLSTGAKRKATEDNLKHQEK